MRLRYEPSDRCTDLRTIEPRYGYREVYRLLDCEPSIEPESEPDPINSEPIDAAVHRALKQLGGTSS
jgi:hypothetical protein